VANDGQQVAAQGAEEIAHLPAEHAELRKAMASLQARIANSDARLNRNPRNSSMPPLAERCTKPPAANRAGRRMGKRRPGGPSRIRGAPRRLEALPLLRRRAQIGILITPESFRESLRPGMGRQEDHPAPRCQRRGGNRHRRRAQEASRQVAVLHGVRYQKLAAEGWKANEEVTVGTEGKSYENTGTNFSIASTSTVMRAAHEAGD
jgi:hypothetical protein